MYLNINSKIKEQEEKRKFTQRNCVKFAYTNEAHLKRITIVLFLFLFLSIKFFERKTRKNTSTPRIWVIKQRFFKVLWCNAISLLSLYQSIHCVCNIILYIEISGEMVYFQRVSRDSSYARYIIQHIHTPFFATTIFFTFFPYSLENLSYVSRCCSFFSLAVFEWKPNVLI